MNIFVMGALWIPELKIPEIHNRSKDRVNSFPPVTDSNPPETKFNTPEYSMASEMNKIQNK